MNEVPQYGLRAYALFLTKHGPREEFKQSDLDWIVSTSMKKKIFSVLTRAGWITKVSRMSYRCVKPEQIFSGLLDFRVPKVIKEAKKPYVFTGLSAVEVWSDYVYVLRGKEKSPYYVKILKRDMRYWKQFFNAHRIPNYVGSGATIGEFVILIPVSRFAGEEKNGVMVESLRETQKIAKENKLYAYPCNYIRKKYGTAAA